MFQLGKPNVSNMHISYIKIIKIDSKGCFDLRASSYLNKSSLKVINYISLFETLN